MTKPVAKPKHSSVRDHVMTCGSGIPIDNFRIVANNNKEIDLCIIELILIHKDKPILNDTNSSFPLKLL